LTPGRYGWHFSPVAFAAYEWFLESALVLGRETLDTGLELSSDGGVTNVSLVFSDRPTELTGTLLDAAGHRASSYFVIVYARDRSYWRPPSRRVAMARPDSNGRYAIEDLPPGEYYLAAMTDVAPGEWRDPSLLEQLVAGSVVVSLAPGEPTVRDIRLAAG
jgi:hypothetical protein